MDKERIDRLLPLAYEAISKSDIPDEERRVTKTFRSYISSFGASVCMGSLLAAIAFFSDQGGAKHDRSKLLEAIFRVLQADDVIPGHYETLYDWAKEETGIGNGNHCKEAVIQAAVAIKLALNLYPLDKKENAQ